MAWRTHRRSNRPAPLELGRSSQRSPDLGPASPANLVSSQSTLDRSTVDDLPSPGPLEKLRRQVAEVSPVATPEPGSPGGRDTLTTPKDFPTPTEPSGSDLEPPKSARDTVRDASCSSVATYTQSLRSRRLPIPTARWSLVPRGPSRAKCRQPPRLALARDLQP